MGCLRTAGSASFHSRLLIAGPLQGRQCCGGLTLWGGKLAARLPAAKRSNYSITAGKRSAPADRCYHYITAPRGSNMPRTFRTGTRRMYLPLHRHRCSLRMKTDARPMAVRPPWDRQILCAFLSAGALRLPAVIE